MLTNATTIRFSDEEPEVTLPEDGGTVSRLPGLLRWSGSNESVSAIFRNYQRQLFLAWGYSLMQVLRMDPEMGRTLSSKARRLPQDAFNRFLTAPPIVHKLAEAGSAEGVCETTKFLADALDAEYCRLTGRVEGEFTVWTALGDFNISSGPEPVFRAPLAAGQIPVDCRSPFVTLEEMDRFYGPYSAFTTLETSIVLDKLNDALVGISRSNERVLEFIKLFTRVIVVRKNAARPDQVGSRSFSPYVGATIIENPHSGETDAVALAESLVHEAIHHLLYSEELQRPFVAGDEVSRDFRVPSPWTGRNLNLRQYLHACVVWYGLWSFWSQCTPSTVFPEAAVLRHTEQAAQGFEKGSLLHSISQVFDYVSLELWQAISNMQATVTSRA